MLEENGDLSFGLHGYSGIYQEPIIAFYLKSFITKTVIRWKINHFNSNFLKSR